MLSYCGALLIHSDEQSSRTTALKLNLSRKGADDLLAA